MRLSLGHVASLLCIGLVPLALAGCHRNSYCAEFADDADGAAAGTSGAPQNAGNASPPSVGGSAERAIAEADIVQVVGTTLYAMSKSGTVTLVDVSDSTHLTLVGQATLPGRPFEMYVRGSTVFAMTDGAFTRDGRLIAAGTAPAPAIANTETETESAESAAIVTLDVADPVHPSVLAVFPVAGAIADSRIVGDALYLATYENSQCFGCGAAPRTMVSSFDVRNPRGVVRVDQKSFASTAPESFNLPWGSGWKRSIVATTSRLYIGGHGDIDPATFGSGSGPGAPREGIIDVLDITDPGGKLVAGAHLTVAGSVLSRWQMDETDGVLRVVSQRGAGRTGNGIGEPEIQTFRIDSTSSYAPLGNASIHLPRQEGLRAVRFDGDRAYAITYNQTDPLFTLDLHDPANPKTRGELLMPGFVFHLEPHGDRVLGLGVDRDDPVGSLNVSLFDVADMDHPTMLQRASFGAQHLSEDFQILNLELPEDQDRIQKAFKVFEDGTIAVPFTMPSNGYDSSQACTTVGSGIQLLDWKADTLTKSALLPMLGNPRRALHMGTSLLGVSDSNVTSFSLAAASYGQKQGDLVIGSCVSKEVPGYGPGGGGGGGWGGPGDGRGGHGNYGHGNYGYSESYDDSSHGCD